MAEQNEAKQEQPVFRLQKMYIKDLSFESPNAPQIFLARNQEPKVDFNLQVNSKKMDDDHWEVVISITTKVMDKNASDTMMFVVEVEHAGVFLLKNIPAEHVQRVLAVDCPLMLFPLPRVTFVSHQFTKFPQHPVLDGLDLGAAGNSDLPGASKQSRAIPNLTQSAYGAHVDRLVLILGSSG